eukprot:TRINITY_DN109947_c0_g1_i1.p1 TRINITY_DN109947_c0_g1~~TRINITY_DN109947_c0_g1_i1.p1  ORF type:complete len:188 (+),score=66.53 TRINITY_DN109947_c0_g1_i1:70-633(+)
MAATRVQLTVAALLGLLLATAVALEQAPAACQASRDEADIEAEEEDASLLANVMLLQTGLKAPAALPDQGREDQAKADTYTADSTESRQVDGQLQKTEELSAASAKGGDKDLLLQLEESMAKAHATVARLSAAVGGTENAETKVKALEAAAGDKHDDLAVLEIGLALLQSKVAELSERVDQHLAVGN